MTYTIYDIRTNKEVKFEDLPNCPHIGEEIHITKHIPNGMVESTITGKVIRVIHWLHINNHNESFVTIYIT